MEVTGKRADSVSEPCKACQIEGRCTQADGYCQDCDENMCQKCFQHHVKGKLCRNHVMSPLGSSMLQGQDKSECNEKCRTHTTENIKYYCREHDMITCGDCNVAEHHGCKIEFIGNVADQYENSSKFEAIFKKIEQLDFKNNESRTKIDNHRKENKMFLDKALSEINNFRKELNDYLDRMEEEIFSEANNTSKENDELMSKLEMMTSVVQQDIDDLMNNLDSTIIHGNKLFIRTREYKPKLYKVEEHVSYIMNNNLLKGFAFEQEEQLVEMVRSGIKLGCLRLETSIKNEQPTEPLKPELTKEVVPYEKDVEAKQKHLASDLLQLPTMCAERKCEGKYWKISPVEQTRSIQVTGLNPEISKDSVSLYFENKRRSDGGEVEQVVFRAENRDCIVTFMQAEDAERTYKKGKHVLDGQTIEVRLYYACLDLSEEYVVKIPAPITFENLDDSIRMFLLKSPKYRSLIENGISSYYGRVVWEYKSGDNTCIQIECIVDPKDRHGLEKVKHWTEKCTQIVNDFWDVFSVQRSHSIAVELWPELKSRLREISVRDPQEVAVIVADNECVVVVVGEGENVRNVYKQIEKIVDEIRKKMKEENQEILKKVHFKKYEIALLRAARLDTRFKKDQLELSIDGDGTEIVFKGKQKDVDDALAKLKNIMMSFVSRTVPGFTREAKDLLFRKEARDFIKAKLNKEKIIGVWDVPRGFEVIIHSRNMKDLDKAVLILKESLKIDTIQLDPVKASVLRSDAGIKKLNDLKETHEGLFMYSLHQSEDEIHFACVEHLHNEIKSEINSFIDLNTIISQFVPTDIGTYSFIIQYKLKELDSIVKQYSRLAVSLTTVDKEQSPGFTVKGKKDGCRLAIKRLQQVIDSVVHKDLKLPWPGFDKFLRSKEGSDEMKLIELNEKCVIKVFEDSTSNRRSQSEDSSSYKGTKTQNTVHDLKFWEHKSNVETSPITTVHIYAGSSHYLDRAVSKIEDIRRGKDLFVISIVRDHFKESNAKDLQRIGYSNGVKVVVSNGCIKVMGYGKAADAAIREAQMYLKDLVADIRKNKETSTILLPLSWKGMKITDPTTVVGLPVHDPEFVKVAQRFSSECSFPYLKPKILKIERIQNPTLYTQFVGKKRQMEIINKGGRPVGRQLWHGTQTKEAVSNIIQKGFDRNYNSGSSYGVGVYFAVNPQMSLGYCSPDATGQKYILLADVLTGEYEQGSGGIRVPPTRPDGLTYDSTTDNVAAPSLFVVYHDAQAYPTFVITFL